MERIDERDAGRLRPPGRQVLQRSCRQACLPMKAGTCDCASKQKQLHLHGGCHTAQLVILICLQNAGLPCFRVAHLGEPCTA